MQITGRMVLKGLLLGSALGALGACDGPINFDLRNLGGGFNTANGAARTTAPRPTPDNRGIISYPTFQVAVARAGDTVADVAARIGLPAQELASYNGLTPQTKLRPNEVLALPRRVSEPSAVTGAITSAPIDGGGVEDITSLAEDAINRAGNTAKPAPGTPGATPSGREPLRHTVERGETAYSISRLYNVSVRALAEWNGLGPDLTVREGQVLLIPVVLEAPDKTTTETAPPGKAVAAPPPSAAKPLPAESPGKVTPPPSPKLGNGEATSNARLVMPVDGKIIRPYSKGKNEGIDIAAKAGAPVRAADDGVVAAITRDTEQVPIIVLRHAGNLLTVYAGVDNLSVKKGDKVKRGEVIAKVRAGKPSFVHFEVREGFDSVDPMPYLN